MSTLHHATGPLTPEGKARSSQNSTIHGFTAAVAVLPGEDAEALAEIERQIQRDRQPASYLERRLCFQLAEAQFRLDRITATQTALLDLAAREDLGAPLELSPDSSPAHRIAASFLKRCPFHHALALLARYETAARRAFYQALQYLRQLQARRGHESRLEQARIINSLRQDLYETLRKHAPQTNYPARPAQPDSTPAAPPQTIAETIK